MPTSSHQMEFGSGGGGGGGGDDEERKWRDREALRHIIGQWNANRLDLFSLSEPNEEFEFHGVMRFYFQDAGQKIATKCIRVSSTASTQAVIETLIEKFRPDMKMLHMAAYALYEIHPNGEERCLGVDEKPLLVQLNWHKDDREGRFLLRRADEKSTLPATQPPEESSFRRKLSKREKRNAKKENKLRKLKSSDGGGGGGNDGGEGGGGGGHDSGVAEKLYTELPETSFTRSISNPEAVMRRRRQQKLERKLQLFRSKDGGPDTGGTLKIYGESLCRDVPYKTLLLSVRETAAYVVREMLDKYGLNREDPTNFCLVQVTPASPPSSPSAGGGNEPPPHEYILEDDECPLSILMNHTPGSGPVMFHVRRRPNDSSAQAARRRKKKLSGGGSGAGGGSGERGGSVSSTSTLLMQHHQAMGMASSESRGGGGGHHHHHHPTAASAFAGGSIGGAATGGGGLAGLGGVGSSSANAANPNAAMDEVMERWPYLVELNPDGSEVRHMQQPARRHLVTPGTVTEVGSDTVVHHTVATAAGRNGGGGAAVGIQLFGPGIQPRHCVLAQTEGMVTLTPCSPHAETYVNGQRLCETTLLRHGCVVRFGRPSPSNAGGAGGQQFRFVDPTQEFRTPAASTAVHYDRYTGQPGPPPPSSTNASVPVAAKAAAAAGQQQQQQHGTDPILPAVLELPEEVEDAFLHSLIPNLDARQQMAFRLAPTYALYLMARYRASTHFRPELNPMERAQRLTLTLSRVGAMMQAVVQERYADPPSLAFWMANASELLHFLKSDRHICAFSLDGQDLLAEAVQIAFRNASACLTAELLQSTPPLLSPPNPTIITPLPSAAAADDEQQQQHDAADESATAQVLAVLSSTMGLLRRCRVNAALTIQLFSQLFHALNAALFNRLVGMDTPRLPGHSSGGGGGAAVPNMCSRQWGMALARRLKRLEAWAERQGLELAADCHLARVMQAAHLLQSPKQTAEQLIETAQSCFKLNSLQLRALLERYHGDGGQQQQIPAQLIAHIVRVAETTSDELQLADGRPLRLDEDSHLQVPFLLPDDGYSCDVMRGVPQGLHEVIGPLQQAGLCRLTPQPTSSGLWTIYMGHEGGGAAAAAMMQPATSPQPPPMAMQQPHRPASAAGGTAAADYHQQQQQPELQLLQLRKASDSMGLSIVAARGTGQQQLGIYIKSVVKGGSADLDGRLQAGDQLLSVDGYSLVGITQDRAAEILMRTSHTVRLEVARQAAMYHGLATLLSQPSPPNSAHTSRSTLSLNKIPLDGPSLSAQQQQQQRGGVPSSAAAISGSGMRPPQQSQSYQERLVDWDRPSHQQMMMTSSNSMGELASVQQQQQQQPARPPSSTGMRQQTMATATSRSVSALHDQQQQQQHAAEASFAAQQQQQHQQMMQRQQMMGNQRAVSAQHLVPPQQQQQQQRHSGGAMPMQMNQQQMPLVLAATDPQRSRSVQNLSEAQQRAAAMMTQQQQQQQQRARHPSNPSAAAAASEDERQYQNIALYQQQQQQQTMGRPQQQQQSRAQLLLSPQQAVGGSARSVSSSVGGGPLAAAHLRQTGPSQSSESPPPPPPPPVSTHPLLAVGGAGGGGTAWEREERERQEAMRRQEAARQWMQEQIDELESLPASQRTTKQEEQLRSLRLEMEFRKRAMEAAAHEDDEDGDEDGGEGETAERRGMLRLVQEDLERARQWRLEKQQMQQLPLPPSVGSVGGPPQQQQPLTNGGGGGVNNNNTSTVPDQERMRKIEAFQRKQRELEATQAAEERIIREAQRRKEDEMLLQHQQRHLQQQQQQHQQWRPQPGNVPIPPSHHSSAAAAAAPSQRLDSLIVASSSSSQESHVVTNVATTTKRVSFFQEPATTDQHQQQHHQQQRSSREEADAFITEAENMLSSTGAGTTSPPRSSQQHHQITQMMEQQQQQQLLLTGTSTPGVIGAQEVYRDPRARRLAEQQLSKTLSQAQAGKTVPEKLTFAEKMRMFALESGEEAAPKDKSKHSSKQREIEQLGTAAAAAAAPGGPNTATKQQIK